jgi:hypothetical protein
MRLGNAGGTFENSFSLVPNERSCVRGPSLPAPCASSGQGRTWTRLRDHARRLRGLFSFASGSRQTRDPDERWDDKPDLNFRDYGCRQRRQVEHVGLSVRIQTEAFGRHRRSVRFATRKYLSPETALGCSHLISPALGRGVGQIFRAKEGKWLGGFLQEVSKSGRLLERVASWVQHGGNGSVSLRGALLWRFVRHGTSGLAGERNGHWVVKNRLMLWIS